MNQPQQNFQPYTSQPQMIAPVPRPSSGLTIVLAVVSWVFSFVCLVSFMAYGSMATDGSRMDSMGVAIVQNQCLVGGALAFLIGFIFLRLRRI